MDIQFKHTTIGKILLLALAAGVFTTASAAEISGKVFLKGTAPPELNIPLTQECSKHAPLKTQFYVVAPDGGLANVFVYIKNPPAITYPTPAQEALLDQSSCLYHPYVMAVMTHQKVRIRNSDPFLHNVNTSASPNGANRFNIPQPTKGNEFVKTFDKPEVPVKVACNVHNWMFSFIGVFDHPYFAVTDKDGNYKLPADLPAGTYTMVVKHLKAGEETQQVTVGDGEKKSVNFSLAAPATK